VDTPIPEAYWVEPGFLLAGPYPTPQRRYDTNDRLPKLLQAGIRLFVDLTEKGEAPPYDNYLGGQAYHLHIPLADFAVPAPATMGTILDSFAEARQQQWRVYVHCLGGLGRTGTVIGCYLVRCGMSGDEALKAICKLRANTPSASSPSPETEAQRFIVLRWPVGQ